MIVAARAPSSRTRAHAMLRRGAWLDVGLAGSIVLAACLARLPGLDQYTISRDEGIRAEQLLLMAAGYRPCGEIFCNQGPLLFYALYPTFVLFGQTLAALRSGVVLFSLVGIAATYWVGSLVAGRPAAIVAALIVGLSPTYLKHSRLAFAEVPALAPAILAVGAALLFRRTGRDRWLVGAGLLVALSWLLKPITLAVCVPVGLAILLRPTGRRRNLAVLVAVTAVASGLPTLLVGLSEILEQLVTFRLRSRDAEGGDPGSNWSTMVAELSADSRGIFLFGAAGAVVLLTRDRRAALPLVGWALASLLLLLVHTPLRPKHVVTLIPPVALLAGAGVGLAWRAVRERRSRAWANARTVRFPAAVAGLGAAAYLLSLPVVVVNDRQLIFDPAPVTADRAAYWYPEVVATLRGVTGEHDVIVTDHPYLPFEARRLVPPPLVESSGSRILAKSLTSDIAIKEATRYDAAAVLLWADKLTMLRGFKAWVDRTYVPIRVYAADGRVKPTLYVRPEQVEPARSLLRSQTATHVGVDFEDGVRLTAFGLDRDRLPAGEVTAVNLAWEATTRPSADYGAILQLRAGEGVVWRSDALPLAGLGPGSASWAPGRSVLLSALIRLPRSLKPGAYSLSVHLRDPRGGRLLGPLVGGDEAARPDSQGLPLTTLIVLPRPAR